MNQPKVSRSKRKFFMFCVNLGRSDGPAFECVNSAIIRKVELPYDSRRRGFPEYPETPRFLFDRRLGLPVRDAEASELGLLISDRAKVLFDELDASAFQYLACETVLADGSPGPKHWLCDIVRVLDCVDETSSSLEQGKRPDGEKFFSYLKIASRIVLREDKIADACMFRVRYLEDNPFCHNRFRLAWKDAKFNGLSFFPLDDLFRKVR